MVCDSLSEYGVAFWFPLLWWINAPWLMKFPEGGGLMTIEFLWKYFSLGICCFQVPTAQKNQYAKMACFGVVYATALQFKSAA